MLKRLALSAILLSASVVWGQTTTTYPITAPNSGVWVGRLRAFGVQASPLYVNWIQDFGACSGQSAPFVGFIYLTLPGQTALPCIPLQAGSGNNYGTFAGNDTNGVPFTGSYSLTITTQHRCSGGREGGCHTVFTITDGYFTITQ